MANRKQAIISTIQNELSTLLTVGNGYNNTIAHIYRKVKNLSEITEFPTIIFTINNEDLDLQTKISEETGKQVAVGELNGNGKISPNTVDKLDINIVAVIISETDLNDEGLLSIAAENFNKDITDFFHRKKSISSSLNDIDGVQYSLITKINPYLDDKLHKGVLQYNLHIEYNDNLNEINVSLPSAPTLNLPTNSGTVSTLFPVFDWSSVSDALSYQIQISTDNTFGTIINEQKYLTNTSYTIPYDISLTNGNTYYWRIKSFNSIGYSDWSSVFSFTTSVGINDTDTTVLLSKMSIQPDATRIGHINDFISGLKSDLSIASLSAKFDCLWFFASHSVSGGDQYLNWAIPGRFSCSAVGSITSTIDRGISGNLINAYLNTNYNPSVSAINYATTSASYGLYSRTDVAIAGNDMGVFTPSPLTYFAAKYSDTNFYGRLNDNGGAGTIGAQLDSLRFYAGSRTASNVMRWYKNGTVVANFTTASSAVPTLNFYICAVNNTGNTPSAFTGRQYAFAFIGSSLTNTEINKLNFRVEEYLESLSAKV